MTYRIARRGQTYGPYTEAEVRRYLSTGNILPADLIQREDESEWVAVAQRFPASASPYSSVPSAPGPLSASEWTRASISGQGYPDPPDLPWWMALGLAVVTGGIFIVIWDVVQAAWLRRVEPGNRALPLYLAVAAVYLLRLPSSWATIHYNLFGGPPVGPHHGFLLFLVWLGLFIASRRTLREGLLRHFNSVEPLGLRLNSFFVYLFGGLYIQYHFNRLNAIKQGMRVSAPSY